MFNGSLPGHPSVVCPSIDTLYDTRSLLIGTDLSESSHKYLSYEWAFLKRFF